MNSGTDIGLSSASYSCHTEAEHSLSSDLIMLPMLLSFYFSEVEKLCRQKEAKPF